MKANRIKSGISVAAVVGIAAACIPCCIPLIVPMLAWLGISGAAMVETGRYVEVGAVSAITLGALVLFLARRRNRCKSACDMNTGCGC